MEYFEFCLRRCSNTAELVFRIKWDFIKEFQPKVVLDFGCGVGWFRAYKPENVEVDSFDVANFPQTGIIKDRYDIICLWDVLEHVPDYLEVLETLTNKTDCIALSIPIKPKDKFWKNWKHLRLDQHLHQFDLERLDLIFDMFGFERVKTGQPECPPREDVYDILYRKKNAD